MRIFLPLFIIAALALLSCDSTSNDCINGDGKITKRLYELAEFKESIFKGSGNIHLMQGDDSYIEVITDENIHEYITVNHSGNTVEVGVREHVSICPTEVDFYVYSNDFSKINLKGSGNINNETKLILEDFDIIIEGSGDIDISELDLDDLSIYIEGSGNTNISELNAENIHFRIDGSGNTNLSGEAETINITINGSGSVDTYNCPANEVTAIISGSGDITVWAIKKLIAKILGSGDIRYKGNPEMKDTQILGSGVIKQIN